MGTRNIQEWFKLTFRVLVSEKWDVIGERVENGDPTYRWLREILILKLGNIERSAWQSSLAAEAFSLKERLFALNGYIISEEDFLRAQHWARGLLFAIGDSSLTVSQRVMAARLSLVENLLKHHDNDTAAGNMICSVFDKLIDIEEVVNAIYDKTDQKLAYEVKEVYDLAKEYAATMKLPIDRLVELEFEEGCLPSEPPVEPYTPPETWVFGDSGDKEGMLSSPYKVEIDKEGNYLVMDQDLIPGPGIITYQRLQLFNPLGKLIKVILTRGEGKVNGMDDFCLDKSGNLIVTDLDDKKRARIQVFDYDGNQLLLILLDEDNPDSLSRILTVFNDEHGNIIATDIGCTCVWVFGSDGKVKSRFGKWGPGDDCFRDLRCAYANDNKIYAFDQGGDVILTKVFDYNGNFLKSIWPGYSYMQIVFHTDDKIYTALSREIHRIDLHGNKEVVAKKGDDGLDDFHVITSMAFHPDGRLVVSDAGTNRWIKVFKIKGTTK